jgi:Transposase IS116/IS110/IS902 family
MSAIDVGAVNAPHDSEEPNMQRLKEQILEFDRRILAWHRSNETSRRLDAIPGIGPALATALVASVADAKTFRSGRHFSAWIGLVPKQHSSGGKDKLGSISKQGDRYLRSLFTKRCCDGVLKSDVDGPQKDSSTSGEALGQQSLRLLRQKRGKHARHLLTYLAV